jgi:hypothetical protein
MVDFVGSPMETAAGRLYKPQPWGIQACFFVAAFAGAVATGWSVGALMPDLSESARTFLYLPFVMIFFLGYGLWLARLNALAFQFIGKGILKALFMLIVLRRKPQKLEDVLPSREKILEMLVRGQQAASSFFLIAVPVGIVAGLIALLFDGQASPLTRAALVTGGCIAWGWLLMYLGRRGYLPFPEEGE